MTIDISNIFKMLGPAASIIFAAWIFMGFLQQRYNAAVERYLVIIGQYRTDEPSEGRRKFIRAEILTYRRRCALMNVASAIGLVAAIILIVTLMIGEMAIILPHLVLLQYLGAGAAFFGLALVIAASLIVLVEGSIINQQLENEMLDVPDLADLSRGQPRGALWIGKERQPE